MKFIDKSKYIHSVLNDNKTVQQIYKVNRDDIYWYEGLLNENWINVVEIVKNLLTEIPFVFNQDEIKNHLNRCYDYAESKEVSVCDCYHYYSDDIVSNDDIKTLVGIRINSISPLLIQNLYSIDLRLQKSDNNMMISQVDMNTIYEADSGVLNLQESSFIDVYDNTLWKYNFNSEKVKSLFKQI